MARIDADELDRIFDEGKEDVLQYADLSTLTRLGQDRHLVSVGLSEELIESIDQVARSQGTDRQAVIEGWLVDGAQAASA
ncbi:MAG: hypothetical protein FWD59_06240 [Micrococcales bacterium]|nr:hypothetical protein [Micrococcales bacterium]